MSKSNPNLFTPLKVGSLVLDHRVVLAPLTRMRAGTGDVPTALMADYYAQRASEGGLLISEATSISVTARGYLGAPGIYSDAQIAGWKTVVDAVHAKGGHIFLQLWHVGRTSHTDMTGGVEPVGPSVAPYEGLAFTKDGWVPVSLNRSLSLEEIPGIVNDYRKAAERARAAGFDGVEVHGANGYLLDQFLQDGVNRRTDAYGGTAANRARLLIEVTEAVVGVWGPDRVGVRLSPNGSFNGMSDSNPTEIFEVAVAGLAEFGLAYLHLVEPRVEGSVEVAEGMAPVASVQLGPIFGGIVIAAGGFDGAEADNVIGKGEADLVAFGRHFIANPDLPYRYANGLPLNAYDRKTFYGGDIRGYTDYPFYDPLRAVA